MPDLTISLTANQAQRVAAALGVSTNAEAVAKVKALLKEKVKDHEAQQATNSAHITARAQVDTDFAGF